jgi:hypothetical protein
MRETFYVSGSTESLEQLAAALRKNQVEGIEISAPQPAKGTLLSRAPLGQFGLFEILISVAANLASSAAYDGIKRVIGEFSQGGKVKVVTASKPTTAVERSSYSTNAKKTPSKSKAAKKRSKK